MYNLTSIIDHVKDERAFRATQLAGTDVSSLFASTASPSLPGKSPIELMPSVLATQEWWLDDRLVVGRVTKRVVEVQFVNFLTKYEVVLSFPQEWTLAELIKYRMSAFNSHTRGYLFKHAGKILDESKTMLENGVVDLAQLAEMDELGIATSEFLPTVFMHFACDDLAQV